MKKGTPVRELTSVAKALGDTNRVRILAALRGRELCVCQMAELLGLAASTVSKHMSILRQAYLVDSRKEGRWVYYRRVGASAPDATRRAVRWVDSALQGDPTVQADEDHLEKILQTPVAEVCRRYGRG
jgi:DNA-binding transcriptional ArsR family regulator